MSRLISAPGQDMNELKVIIFDLDGTVLDSAPGIIESLTFAMRQLGHDFQPIPDTQRLFGPPMHDVVAHLLKPFGDDRITECLALYRAHYRKEGLYNCSPYPGILEALEVLSSTHYSLFVATSKRQEFADKMLVHTGLSETFQGVFGTSPDGTLDDKTDLLRLLLLSLERAPSCTFMIGDKGDDMRAACQNSVVPVGALWGYGSSCELNVGGASMLVASPEVLPDVIAVHLQTKKSPATECGAGQKIGWLRPTKGAR
ncbi:HAD hydrolase-like protein [Pseudomonas sp. NPDC086251]|uniref:HAD hydrolase-like protein n=1 Tax=Pseudomonas sp. NPDC086251 TaxID=3364431 RepID=UPI0038371930